MNAGCTIFAQLVESLSYRKENSRNVLPAIVALGSDNHPCVAPHGISLLRKVSYDDFEAGKRLVFLTNNLTLLAANNAAT